MSFLFFNAFLKSLLPHNFLYALKVRRFKIKNSKKVNLFDELKKKTSYNNINYSIEDAKNYKYFLEEFSSKINNLEN